MHHSNSSNERSDMSLESSPLLQIAEVWSWLPAFRAVAESSHLPTASRQLSVSASALSRSVRLLEAGLGVELFHRVGSRLELTDSGHAFLHAVRIGMRSIHDGMLAARSETLTGVLRISSSGAATTIAVVPALLDVRTQHPDLRGVVVTEAPEDESAALSSGRLDLVVRSAPIRSDDLTSVEVGTLTHGVYCGDGHPLLERQSESLLSEDLAAFEFVSPGTDAQGRSFDGWPDRIERRIAIQVDQMRVGAEVCARGDLLAVLPDRLVDRLALPLHRLPLEIIPDVPVFVVTRTNSGTRSRVSVVLDAIVARMNAKLIP
jgi:DNA-binding transcriptional LysR family regulator